MEAAVVAIFGLLVDLVGLSGCRWISTTVIISNTFARESNSESLLLSESESVGGDSNSSLAVLTNEAQVSV